MSGSRASEPFRFCTRLGLTLLTGLRAHSVRELADHLRGAPDAVVYEHTHRFLQQHQYLVPEPPNDFAYWVSNILQDDPLGERLAAIDTVRFDSLPSLRRALVEAMEAYLRERGDSHRVRPGREFHLMGTVRFSLPTPYEAYDLAEFVDCLGKVSLSSLYLHVFEARLRPPLGVNDFSSWFEKELGERDLARKVAGLDPYTQTMEGLRSRIIGIVSRRLEESPHAET
jgi:hypothetical protein